jgi:uncharacterized protein involved in exopolysaccharide biosynthesis
MVPAQAPNRRADFATSGELDITDYLVALWQQRLLIVGCAVIAAAVAVAVTLTRDRQYEAVTLVSVSPSKVPQEPARPVSPESLVPLIESQSVAETVVRELKLDTGPDPLTPETLLQRLDGAPLSNTNLIRISVRLPNAELAARVANRSAEIAMDLYRRINAEEVGTLEGDLQGMLTEAQKRMRAAQDAYETYRREAQHELLKRDVETLLEQRGDYLELVVEIEGERAKLARAEEELAKRRPLGTMTQSIDKSPSLMEAARSSNASGDSVLGLQMRSDYVNDVFMKLDEEVATGRATLAQLEKKRAQMISAAGVNADQLAKLTRLYVTETTLERLKDEVDISRKAYQSVAERYQGAKLAATAATPRVQVVVPAAPPERPVSRMLARNLVLGAALGFVVGAFIALVRFALRYVNDQSRTSRRLTAT